MLVRKMDTRLYKYQPHPADGPEQELFQRELDMYVAALYSYPVRLAKNPFLSFEDHLLNVTSGQGSDWVEDC
jgi:hypothetical protein